VAPAASKRSDQTLITFVVVPTVYAILEEGWKGLRSGLPKHS